MPILNESSSHYDPTSTSSKLLYSRPEAARCLGLSVRAIDHLIANGTLRVRRIDGRVLIHVRTLEGSADSDQAASVVPSYSKSTRAGLGIQRGSAFTLGSNVFRRTHMPIAPPQPLFYSRKEAAELLRISLRSVAYLIAHGDLETRKLGGRRLVPVASLERFARGADRPVRNSEIRRR